MEQKSKARLDKENNPGFVAHELCGRIRSGFVANEIIAYKCIKRIKLIEKISKVRSSALIKVTN
jgi:hypothetical protein